jgi:3-phosphoshikimate 1-carboxyvinyltransferase
MAAGVVTGGKVEIAGVGTHSRQGDIAFLDDLACMGCKVAANARSLVAGGRPTSGIQADLNATPDLVPPLAAVALLAPGPSRLTGIGHLRGKESDRLAALASEFSRLGGQVTAGDDFLEITPAPLHGAAVSAHDDHRIAMALAIVALCVDGVDLDDPDCVGKSYPGFFRDLDRILAG